MAITVRSELLTAIQTWLARSDSEITTSDDDFITSAEARIFYGAGDPLPSPPLRIRAMEAYQTFPLSAVQAGATTAGTADAQTSALVGYALAYGATASMLAGTGLTNTTTMTVNIQSTGVKTVKKGQARSALAAGDWRAAITHTVWYDGTDQILVPVPGAIPLPTTFLEPIRLWLGADPRKELEPMTRGEFWKEYAGGSAGTPKSYTLFGDCIIPGPQQNAAGELHMLSYNRFAALTGASDTNWLLTNHPFVYLYAALIEACVHTMWDERIAAIHALYRAAIEGLNVQDRRGHFAEDTTEVPADYRVNKART